MLRRLKDLTAMMTITNPFQAVRHPLPPPQHPNPNSLKLLIEVELVKHTGTNWSSRFHTITDAIRNLSPAANKTFGRIYNYQLVELTR